jgi:hypothetical protein
MTHALSKFTKKKKKKKSVKKSVDSLPFMNAGGGKKSVDFYSPICCKEPQMVGLKVCQLQ